MKKIYLIPEWQHPSFITLVWPEHLPPGVGKLQEFYKSFIRKLSEEQIRILLLYKDEASDKTKLERIFNNNLVKIIHNEEVSDIWVRDFGPIFLNSENSVIPINFEYNPSYIYSTKEKEWTENNNKVGKKLASDSIEITVGSEKLILDGGNFIHNGLGTAIVTNRIVSDNEYLFDHEIRGVLEVELGIEELLIVPSEPGDDTGHIDGLVRFFDPNTLVVSQYPDKYFSEKDSVSEYDYNRSKETTDKIAAYLKKQDFKVLRLINSIPKKGKYKIPCKFKGERFFENATGNYMNFLRVGNKIFLPQYNNPVFDEEAYEFFKIYKDSTNQDIQIIKAPNDATKLAEYGGVLNCISLPLYDQLPDVYYFKNQFVVIAKEETNNNELEQIKIIYIARRKPGKIHPKEYNFADVVMVDFRNGKVYEPNSLQSICKYREPVFIDLQKDDPDNLFERVFEIPSIELRKLWELLYASTDNELT